MTDQTIETVDNVVNEYYKLKNKYETENKYSYLVKL